MKKTTICISSCLLGNKTCYNDSHEYNELIQEFLGGLVCFVPFCPEVECGMPVPREGLRLHGNPDDPDISTEKSKQNMTAQMKNWAQGKLKEIAELKPDGFIFKAESPSCGINLVKFYDENGKMERISTGVFALLVKKHFPDLPIEDETAFQDEKRRTAFLRACCK
jgi:uncharacterized protein YbbK (DUF523 family)